MAYAAIVRANLVSLCIASPIYGIFFVLFLIAGYVINLRAQRLRTSFLRSYRDPIVGAAGGFFATITAGWVLAVYRSFQAFRYYEGGIYPEIYYDLNPGSLILKDVFWVAAVGVGDATLIYRLWVIYRRKKTVIIFPAATFVTAGVLCIAVIHYVRKKNFYDGVQRYLIAGAWMCSFITNLYCCAFIVFRMWFTTRHQTVAFNMEHGSRAFHWVLSVFIESAFLLVSWTIFYLIAYETSILLTVIVQDAWPIVAGIAFMLIMIRVGLGFGLPHEPTSFRSRSGLSNSNPLSTITDGLNITFEVDVGQELT